MSNFHKGVYERVASLRTWYKKIRWCGIILLQTLAIKGGLRSIAS